MPWVCARLPFLVPAGVAVTLLTRASVSAESSYFRSDAGVLQSAGSLPENFDAPEALRWRVALEAGHSSPILNSGKIFLTTWRPEAKELATLALDQEDGKLL